MYASYFGLAETPFSITPDPRYLFMSSRHREAMAHLVYGLKQRGGFVQLTGEVGTGKTTLCRYLLSQLPVNIEVALVLNPTLNKDELLATVCDELHIEYPEDASSKQLLDRITAMLLKNYAAGKRTVLIIDEAQILRQEVLEQVRLLTNLETSKHKLLQIILIGQPELIDILGRPELRQLAQRITARYHLEPLSAADTAAYVKYRLSVAGRRQALFTDGGVREVYRKSKGVPRLINVICDRALLGAYARNKTLVSAQNVRHAAKEVLGKRRRGGFEKWWWAPVLGGLLVGAATMFQSARTVSDNPPLVAAAQPAPDPVMVVDAAPAPVTDTGAADVAPEPVPASEGMLYPSVSVVATPAQRTTQPTLTELLRDQGDALTSRKTFARLVSLWQPITESVEQVESCPEAKKLGLECLAKRGNWDDLRSHNRAAILPLVHTPQSEAYLLLVNLTASHATVD
ncbi:MAG: AAA family ATPase, partial [Gammaproteobacteria bacterium]|nr:AAA family ATPase [Gammaproteobacteria bacterium]